MPRVQKLYTVKMLYSDLEGIKCWIEIEYEIWSYSDPSNRNLQVGWKSLCLEWIKFSHKIGNEIIQL